LDDFGVLGIGLATRETDTAQGAAGTGQGAADADQETLLVFTQTSADVDTTRTRAAELGPMWDRHLRLFARSLVLAAAEATEPELVAAYSDLELHTSGGESLVNLSYSSTNPPRMRPEWESCAAADC